MSDREILLWGISGDPQIDALLRELKRRGESFLFLDQRRYATVTFDVEAGIRLQGKLECAERTLDIGDVGSIFVRPLDGRDVARADSDDDEWEAKIIALERALFAWTDVAEALVLNRPGAMASNSSKPRQCERIRTHGFSIPNTLVTTTPADARAFIAEYGRVICKSTSGQMSITSRVDADDFAHIDDIRICPTQFQQQIDGTDWRVHVIGDEVFACEVRCSADDYRVISEKTDALNLRPAPLPPDVAARCLAVANDFDLPVAGLDLRRTDDGEWFCFEVNGAPSLHYFESATDQPLIGAVAHLLVRGARGSHVERARHA